MAVSIIRLFSGGQQLTRFWDQLEVDLNEACSMALTHDPTLHQGSLFLHLRERFILHPITLGHLEEVTIKAAASDYTSKGQLKKGHRASARVSFMGSKLLLQSQPEPGYQFPFRGQVTRHALKLHRYLPDMDGRAFAADVNAELDRIRPALADYRKMVHEHDQRLVERIQSKISSF